MPRWPCLSPEHPGRGTYRRPAVPPSSYLSFFDSTRLDSLDTLLAIFNKPLQPSRCVSASASSAQALRAVLPPPPACLTLVREYDCAAVKSTLARRLLQRALEAPAPSCLACGLFPRPRQSLPSPRPWLRRRRASRGCRPDRPPRAGRAARRHVPTLGSRSQQRHQPDWPSPRPSLDDSPAAHPFPRRATARPWAASPRRTSPSASASRRTSTGPRRRSPATMSRLPARS